MINMESYVRPGTIDEALDLLGKNQGKVLAGGTDLILDLQKKELAGTIVDVGGIKELQQIKETEDQVIIGSVVSFTQVETSPIIQKYCLALSEAAGLVGSPQIRNQGTIGGNIANASPAADTVPAFVAMDALLRVGSIRGERIVRITDLLLGIGKTDLAPDELILEISFKKLHSFRSSFIKLGRRNALAISRMSGAAGIRVDEEGRILEARIALGSVAPNPFRSTLIESVLVGKNVHDGIPEEAIETAYKDVEERLGSRATAPYKKEAIKGVVRQALEKIFIEPI